MVRDYADGYGYDKRSAAVQHAASKISDKADNEYTSKESMENSLLIRDVLKDIGGKDWNHALQDAGFTVFQAV